MKTFLHYTKERELDEGVMDRIGGALGYLTRGTSYLRKGAEWFKSNVAPGFEQGAKPGSTLGAVGNVASFAVGKAEEKQSEQSDLDNELIDAEDHHNDMIRKLAKAKTNEDKAYYGEKVRQAKARRDLIGKAKNKKELATKARSSSSSAAANIRRSIP